MRPLRILHLIHHLHLGGAERQLTDLLPCLVELGVDVQVACLDDRGPLFDEVRRRGIPAHFIGRRHGRLDLAAFWRLRRLLREQRIDVLNTHGLSAALWGRLAAVAARTPRVVVTVHAVSGWKEPRKQYLLSRLLQPATDCFVAVSECVRRSLIEQERVRPEAIRIIHNGLHVERFSRSTVPAEARRKLGLAPGGPLIGFVGRCSPEKGGATWVRAMARLVRADGNLQGVLVGDGPRCSTWQALAAAEGVSTRIRFVGGQVDIVPWLAVMDVLVCPSQQESFGLAALEAQAAGVPVVATRVDGFLEVLHDGEDALLVGPEDPVGTAEAIHAVLCSEERAKALAAAGRLNAARFTIMRTAQAYAALYRELLADVG
jgi:glycosyltransferase involved in cell wall biosynthesis